MNSLKNPRSDKIYRFADLRISIKAISISIRFEKPFYEVAQFDNAKQLCNSWIVDPVSNETFMTPSRHQMYESKVKFINVVIDKKLNKNENYLVCISLYYILLICLIKNIKFYIRNDTFKERKKFFK